MLRKLCFAVALAAPLAMMTAPAQAQRGLQAEYAAAPSGPVAIGDISFSEDLLSDGAVGNRDAERLSRVLRGDLERELGQAGWLAASADGARLNIVIVDATPNRPTMRQLAENPSLSPRSFGAGGAELEATLVDASGSPVAHFRYSWDSLNIEHAASAGVWTDAERALGFFADRVTDNLQNAAAGS